MTWAVYGCASEWSWPITESAEVRDHLTVTIGCRHQECHDIRLIDLASGMR